MTLKVFEAFSGVGSQAMALRDLGIDYEVVATSDWDYHATLSYNAIHTDNPIDYAKDIEINEIVEYLFKLKISSDGKKPMTLEQIKRLPNQKKQDIYNSFINTNNLGSIMEFTSDTIPDHDFFTYSFPCQDISISGKGEGFDEGSGTRSGLLWECKKIIEVKKPKFLLLENVKPLVGKKHQLNFNRWCNWLENQGYTNYWKILNAKDYGVPQNRERVFMISVLGPHEEFIFPSHEPSNRRLKDVLEKEVEEKFYISDEAAENLLKKSNNPEAVMQDKSMLGMDGYVRGYDVYSPTITAREYKEPRLVQVGQLFQTDSFGGNPQAGRVYDAEGVSPTLNTMQGGNRQPKVILPAIGASRGRPSESGKYEQHLEINRGEASNTLTGVLKDNYVINQNYRIRKLTPLECWRLMDFNDEDFYKAQKVCSNSQLYKQAGNSIVKAVLMAIFRQMFFEQRGNGKGGISND
ncbi:DNA (cytosine-5-)-methyltransferase [Enterococcus termitis]|uniref:Cytosine-specific methyltransferase n=1 Tax=Enterococcus termitis TaxID=332950 RepID=A0A1E5GIG2_9ENTE|nr:DNA (cytosine-5-)-methyltransferase [Enterococcus termitis]OEG12492.1 hypothetical protein BCR25_08115 [Enterococcus termitis]OJG96705.1 hypothetical protein RV18_GL001991 [Enterococcus termitis]